jgi:hypothetical protein
MFKMYSTSSFGTLEVKSQAQFEICDQFMPLKKILNSLKIKYSASISYNHTLCSFY